jgi:cell division protein FtsB
MTAQGTAGRCGIRAQLVAERKLRFYVYSTLALLVFLYLAFNLVFGETGLIRYFELKDRHASLERDIYRISSENTNLRSAITAYRTNDFYVEKHARENFGLARPGEYVFIFKD